MKLSPEIYKDFVLWKALPKKKGSKTPRTVAEFAQKWGVEKSLLQETMETPDYAEDVKNQALQWAKFRVPEILHILYSEIRKSKSTADAEKFMRIAYESERKDKEQSGTTINNLTLSDEQFSKIIAREAKLLSEGGKESPDKLLRTDQS